MKTLSIVTTVFNEESNVAELLSEIASVMQGQSYEIIVVDDGSNDATLETILKIQNEHITVVELTTNYGQSAALAAGIEHATGKYIVTMDGDLQNDPADILPMLEILESKNCDIVVGRRRNRQDNFVRKIPSKIANFIIRSSTKVQINDIGCTLKVMKRNFAVDLGLYGELHRFIPVLAALQGARITQVDVNHRPRKYGKSKYGLTRTFRVLSDLLLILFFQKFMKRPMHLFGLWGIIILFVGVVINIYMIYLKMLGEDIWGKPLLLLGILCVIAGIQFITIGIFAEILIRTYYESQKKKTYYVRNIHSKL